MLAGAGKANGNHVVIKTHQWSDAWEAKQADHIFLTHRDLQGVVASYRRVGWAFDIPDSYVKQHQQWRVSFLPSHCLSTTSPVKNPCTLPVYLRIFARAEGAVSQLSNRPQKHVGGTL